LGGKHTNMAPSGHQIQAKILRRETVPDEYRVYRAGLEWDLTDPIVIESRQDFKSELRWHDQMEPYHHQVTNLITFCRRLPVTLLADDVGLGKTISAGLVASELICRSRVSKILIVCPKLLGPQWQEELQTKFSIPGQIAAGRTLIDADPEGVGAVITTYHSARLYLDRIPEDRFEMLVLDEAHKLRNLYGVDPPPQVAVRFRDALEKRRFRYVLMLTATPIQNRLWDLYSLVDLLTVARGHENPFGSEGMFARKFIADNRTQARQLKSDAREEFRSIVYGYMSRVRRGDAKLYFPGRVVQLHRVEPTAEELELIQVIAKPIQTLNRLAQIGILQALTSSPHALMAQLNTMARNGTVPAELASAVRAIVARIGTTAKLQGLGTLVEKLRQEKPDHWRMVVFTGRLETQTTIQEFLERKSVKVGIINGDSGRRNQDTIARFKKNPPDIHVIVSTEAGSEGINLQVANVLANYDLPWNPMIVEQRIGRIQRLASEHRSVSIFNVILRGTFEEYIVGRLMEKLQMAAHAVGDMEALLEASGISDDEENGDATFDEKIRRLVIAALAGKDVEAATRQEEKSIAEARTELEREEENINRMLGGMEGAEYVGPRAPTLPAVERSMDSREFTLSALRSLGARVSPHADGIYVAEQNGGREFIRFEENVDDAFVRSTLYAPGTPAFSRLVSSIIATGIHRVRDDDTNPAKQAEDIAKSWVASFNGSPESIEIEEVRRSFEGAVLIRVRATVAHDSYERLVPVPCSPLEHYVVSGRSGVARVPDVIEDVLSVGVKEEQLASVAGLDPGIGEFSRFYLERRAQEVASANGDARKRKKLEDDFTPRLDMTIVSLDGTVHRQVKLRVQYKLSGDHRYVSTVCAIPSSEKVSEAPPLGQCAKTGATAPSDCLKRCEISGHPVLRHLLVQSDVSSRWALPEHSVACSVSGQRVLSDEAERSAVTGKIVASSILKTSALSGKRAEPEHFVKCEFTGAEALATELVISEVSGKSYRPDQQLQSVVSGKAGHRKEFIHCHETRQPLLSTEAERCEITGMPVRPGVLQCCELTKKTVLPSELERCAASGKKALKTLFVTSSVSGARIIEQVAIRSAAGAFCSPMEARYCTWSGRRFHPDDLRICTLTGVPIHFQYVTPDDQSRLQALADLLYGLSRTADQRDLWEVIAKKASNALHGRRCKIESARSSVDRRYLAVCSEIRTLLGLRVHYAGLLYSIEDASIVGRIPLGKRTPKGWMEAKL
jgi:superfamily II DNA or RNA helicase